MDFFSILTMLGGLALFLYGMQVMGDGLAKISGGKLEKILENLTSSKLRAVLLGLGVTAVIQSSSATTVMVVGFVNSGIMKLTQAVGIIMGANIGTTVTAWILSLAGIESNNFFMSLLKPSSFAPILALIGIVLLMFTKNSRKKDIGAILVGFAVLMFGMDTMSAAVKPLADVPEFTNLLLAFSNPIAGVLAGTVLTAIIQSSSASVGILQALCVTGAVPYSAAFPIIMGQNIGTCVTALLSAIGANKNAKRAAMIHLYFNIIGTVVFLSVFYILNAAVQFPFMDAMATPAAIAVTHSVFNVTATLLLLPFSNLLVKLACMTIRDSSEDVEAAKEDQEFLILESRFLEKPAFAVEQGRTAARRMAEDSWKALKASFEVLHDYSEEKAQKITKMESKVDRYEDELGTYLVQLNNKDLSETDSHSVSMMLHCIGDFERISDHAVNIKESADELHAKGLSFSVYAKAELRVLTAAVTKIVETAFSVFDEQDITKASEIEALEELIDELTKEMKRRHINRLRSGECTIEMGFILSDLITSMERIAILSDLITSMERIADHCSNIGVCVTQVRENLYDTHRHLNAMKNDQDDEFNKCLEAVRKEYLLP